MTQVAPALPTAPSKTEQAYRRLHEMIVFQELAPGALVSEASLMKFTGLGRTPVREAMQRLASEHMIEIHPSRGSVVSGISAETQLKALELRRPIEELAVVLATRRATRDQTATMRDLEERLRAFDSDDTRTFGALLGEAHHLVATAARNDQLAQVMASLQGPSRRFWFAHIDDPAVELHQGAQLHADILAAIQNRDEDAASKASLRLNRYLVEFTHATFAQREPL